MKERWAFLNDRILPESEAFVSLRDLALNRGYGVFDFFRTEAGVPLFLEDHLDRFYRSAAHLHLPVPPARAAIRQAIRDLAVRNGWPEAGFRLELTGGPSEDGFTPDAPTFFITASDLGSLRLNRPESLSLYPVAYQRQLAEAETIDYLMAIWLQPRLREKGADDALYHSNGRVLECPRSNLFLVSDKGVLVTPDAGLLKGVTRDKVLLLARSLMAVEERPVLLEELETARELFITSTTKGILPVHALDGRAYPGSRGPVARQLSGAFAAYVSDWIARERPEVRR